MGLAGLVIVAVIAVGCTPVQKGTAAGGAVGGATGAAIGHYVTSAGGIAGGVVGFGVGAAAGAIAADQLYGSDVDEGALAEATAEADRLSKELDARELALRDKDAELAKEKAQQQAMLEAYENSRNTAAAPAPAAAPADIQVQKQGDQVTLTVLSSVLFNSGRSELTPEGKRALKQAAQMIRANYADGQVEVRGYTDNVPIRYSPYKSNMDLSRARATAVVRYLADTEGFAGDRLTTAGFGEANPVASNSTADGRKQNRRAEIVVRPKKLQVAEAEPVTGS
jgi:chemotaxis protein MotB